MGGVQSRRMAVLMLPLVEQRLTGRVRNVVDPDVVAAAGLEDAVDRVGVHRVGVDVEDLLSVDVQGGRAEGCEAETVGPRHGRVQRAGPPGGGGRSRERRHGRELRRRRRVVAEGGEESDEALTPVDLVVDTGRDGGSAEVGRAEPLAGDAGRGAVRGAEHARGDRLGAGKQITGADRVPALDVLDGRPGACALGDAVEDRRRAGGVHDDVAAEAGHVAVSALADDGDGVELIGVEGQSVVAVAEQDGAVDRHAVGGVAALLHDGGGQRCRGGRRVLQAPGRRVVDQTVLEVGPEHAVHHVVEPVGGDRAVLDRGTEGGRVGEVRPAHVGARVVGAQGDAGVEVGGDPAREAEVALQRVGHQRRVLARLAAVDLGVGAHDGAGVRLDDGLPLPDVELAEVRSSTTVFIVVREVSWLFATKCLGSE